MTGALSFCFAAPLVFVDSGFDDVVGVSDGRFVSMSADTVAMVHPHAAAGRSRELEPIKLLVLDTIAVRWEE